MLGGVSSLAINGDESCEGFFLVKLARNLTRPGPPKGGLVREFPLFQGNLGW